MTTETQGAAEAVTEDTSAAPVVEEATAESLAAEFEGENDPEPEAAPEADKPKKTAKDRIGELTWEREEAKREAEFWKAKATQAETKPTPAEDAAPASAEDAKPDPNDYEFGVTDERYVEDLADWKVDQRFKERDADEKGRTEFRKTLDTFQGRVTELFPDGEPEGLKAYKALPDAGSMVMQQMVLDSDVGPRLAEHLGTNPAEIQRISGLHPLLQAREIGKLEASLSAPSKAPVKIASDAPAPPSGQARGTGGQFKVSADTNDFAAFDKAYD